MPVCLPDHELLRLEALYRYHILDTSSEPAFDDLTRLAAQICHTPIALISLVDLDRQWFKSKVGLSLSETARDGAFCAYAILQQEPLIVEDALADVRFRTSPLVTAEPKIRFYAGVPLLTSDDYRLGTLCVIDRVPRQLQPEQIEALQILSRQVVQLLELRRNITEHQHIAEEHDRFFNLSLDMLCTVTLDGYFMRLNPSWERILGYSIKELKSTPLIDFVHPDDRATTLVEFEQLLQGGITSRFENRYRCRDGSYKWLVWTAVPLLESGAVYASAREMTDRKRVEIALRHSEEQFCHAFEDTSIGVALVALDGRWMRVNPALCQIVGYSQEALLKLTFQDITHPDDLAADLNCLQQLLKGEIFTYQMEKRYLHQQGQVVWIRLNASVIRDQQGQPLHFIFQVQDINERKYTEVDRKQAEESLRQQAEREHLVREVAQRIRRSLNLEEILNTTVVEIRSLLQNDRVFIYQFEPDWSGKIAFESVGQAFESVLGQTADDPFFKQPEGRIAYEQGQIQAIANIHTAGLTDCHLQLLEQFQIQANLVVPILQEERLWGLLVANQCTAPRQWQTWEIELLKQLSTQVAIAIQQSQLYQQAQLELLERKRAEQKNREQAALLDVATDAIFVKDLQDQILYWNKGAEQLYGWSVEEACGRDTNELLQNKRQAMVEIHQTTLKTGEWHGELQQITKAGKELIVESRWTLVLSESGQPKAILVVNTDITQKKLLERQFLRSQRMESIGTLASGIAHDINNILAPILMSVQLLRRKLPDGQSEQWLEILETSAKRGSKLIKQVLSFARGMDGEHGILQIRHLIAEIKQIVEETFPKSIQIYTYIPRELWTIAGDATHLHQVLMNLCVNARDAMLNGGTLSIRAKNLVIDETEAQFHLDARAGSYVAISITDTGIGIPADLLDRIFEPFFTTKEVHKGTGLGLSTVLGIVKSHQGFITVTSKVNGGTEFQVFLPATDTEEPPGMDETELFLGQGEWILVADDEASIREMARNLLQTYGYKVLTANNGIEAIALYAQHQTEICLVLIDLMMPEMDGETAICALKKMAPNIKVITSSGLLPEAELSGVEKTFVHAFISKPYTAQELLRTIHYELKKH